MTYPDLHTAFPHQELNLYGEAELIAVLEDNRTQGLIPDPEHEQVSPILEELAVEVVQETEPGGDPLADLQPGFREVAQTAQFALKELLAPTAVAIPEFAELATAGIDFEKLQTAYQAMEGLNQKPEFVIAPVLSMEQWQALYRALQDNPRVNSDDRIKDGGLHIGDEVALSWGDLMNQTSTNNGHTYIAPDSIAWQVLVLPCGNTPVAVNVNHNGYDRNGLISGELEDQWHQVNDMSLDDWGSNHINPTIPAYLILQAKRLHTLVPPIDGSTYTWLHGHFKTSGVSSPQAAHGEWNPDDGQVSLYWSDVSEQVNFLGIRLPVWG